MRRMTLTIDSNAAFQSTSASTLATGTGKTGTNGSIAGNFVEYFVEH